MTTTIERHNAATLNRPYAIEIKHPRAAHWSPAAPNTLTERQARSVYARVIEREIGPYRKPLTIAVRITCAGTVLAIQEPDR